MKHIVFEFRDDRTHGTWKRRECTVRSVEECRQIYGLEECEYRIIEIRETAR